MDHDSLHSDSPPDDSLVDVENNIREIESYLYTETTTGTIGGTNPLVALANATNPTAPHSLSLNTSLADHTPRAPIDLASRLSTPSTISTLDGSTARSTVSGSGNGNIQQLNKDELVKRLLQQHRQAQTTAAAHGVPVASRPSSHQQHQQQQLTRPAPPTVLPPPGLQHVDRNQRDALVERLLQERRKQKEVQVDSPVPLALHPTATYQNQQAHPRGSQLSPGGGQRRTPNAQSHQHHPPPLPSSNHSHHSHHTSNTSLDEELLRDSSLHSSSALSPSHTHTSHSSTNSPVDPRFGGIGQTIFDASEWLNEDGTSIIQSNPATHRSHGEKDQKEQCQDESIDESLIGSHSMHTSPEKENSEQMANGEFRPMRAQRIAVRTAKRSRTDRGRKESSTTSTISHSTVSSIARPRSASAVRSSSTARSKPSTSVKRPPTATFGGGPRPAAARACNTPHGIPGGSRYSKKSIISEIEAERAREHTFRPKLISRPLTANHSSMLDRLDAWHERIKKNQARKLEAARVYEEEQLAECTFKPETNVAKRGEQLDPDAAVERLYHEADARVALREKAKALNEQDKLESHPFTPALSDASRKILEKTHKNDRPIFQRIAELQKEKNQKLHEAQMKARTQGLDKDSTFQPRINQTSLQLAEQREQRELELRKEIGQELSQSSSTRLLEKKLSAAHAIQTELERTCTFRPEINPVSEKLLKNSRVFQGPTKDFLTRQERLAEEKKESLSYKQQELLHDPSLTFKPDIGNAEEILQQAKKRMEHFNGTDSTGPNESISQSTTRLSTQESRSLTLLKTKLRSAHAQRQGETFHPEISRVSRILAEKRQAELDAAGVDSSTVRAMAQELLVEKVQEEFQREHTFKPVLNPTSNEMVQAGLVQSHYSHNDMERQTRQLTLDAETKERRMQQLARAQQVSELDECTFQPVVKKGVPKPSSAPVPVKGMSRFLQLKALKAKQDEELRARERKVFMLDVWSEPARERAPYTVPQPFHLSHDQQLSKRDAHRLKVEQESEEDRMRDCTFAPQTKQSQNRQMIQQILQEVDA